MNYLWVGMGGALGSMARLWVSGWFARHLGEAHGTLIVNVTGSFLIGAIATWTGSDGRWLLPPGGRLFFMAGLLGGYTTFSAFSLQTLDLARQGHWVGAGTNVVSSIVCCLVAVWLGYWAGIMLAPGKGE